MSLILKLINYNIDKDFIEAFKTQRLVIFPHTTKMEAFLICMALWATGNRKNFCFCVAIEYMNIPILGSILSYFGAFPILKGTGMTETTIRYLKENKNKSIAISPEGSLSPKDWKKGFFYIAKGASIPISIGGVNFKTHTITCQLDQYHIKEDDTYESKEVELKKAFAECGINPKFPSNSNPYINGSEETTYLSMRGKINILVLFYVSCFLSCRYNY